MTVTSLNTIGEHRRGGGGQDAETCTLTQMVRDTILSYFRANETDRRDYPSRLTLSSTTPEAVLLADAPLSV